MRAALLVLALGSGCGTDEVDLSGVYAVTVDVASAPCGVDTPMTDGPAYLHFFKADLFGQTVFQYDECKDRAATDCFASGGLFESLAEPIDLGWRGRTSSSSMTATRCLLLYIEETAIANGSHLTVEKARYEYDGDIPAQGCTIDEAERRGTTMTCRTHARREAERQ